MFFGKAFLCGNALWGNKKRYHYLFGQTKERLNKELNIIRLVKTIRNIKLFLDSNLMDHKTQFKIHHDAKNYVNIDLSSSDMQMEQEAQAQDSDEIQRMQRNVRT